MSKDIKVVPLTKSMLRKAVDQNTYWRDTLIPLPKSKAIWLLANTRIEEDDYCGIFGFENEKIISFIYMFPDLLNINNTEVKKIYWILSWWVDSKYQNTVLATYIFNEAVNLSKKQVIIKSYAENANKFYKKQPFTIINSRLRYTIFFSLNPSILIGRYPFLKSFKFFLDKANVLIDKLVRIINKSKLKNRVKILTYDYITQLDDETWRFVEPLCKNDIILKTREYVNWQLSNQQYTQTPIPKKFPLRSLQTGISDNINLRVIKILKDKRCVGFLSYVINHKEFNIKYFLVKEEKNYDICVDALIEHFIVEKSNFIFTDDTKLANTITKRYKTIFNYKVLKNALAHNETKLDFKNLEVLNRDGHFY